MPLLSTEIELLRHFVTIMTSWSKYIRSGKPWGVIAAFLANELPDTLEDRGEVAYHLVREAFDRIFGTEDEGWHTFKRPNRDGKQITWIKAGKPGYP